VLPPETESVWKFLSGRDALTGFTLIGGTALALHLRHRRSDDLDLAYSGARLPRKRLDGLRATAMEAGFLFTPNDDEAAVAEFADSAMELHDFQQDFLVNNAVKVSFFVPEASLASVLKNNPHQGPRLASLSQLFKTKCLVAAVRSKTRDWLDLYLLMREHGFTIRDFSAAFKDAGIGSQCGTALARLCSGVPQKNDEGYSHLLANAPTIEQMRDFFVAERNKLEIEEAADAARKAQGHPPQG
jgi:hypothetical protein